MTLLGTMRIQSNDRVRKELDQGREGGFENEHCKK